MIHGHLTLGQFSAFYLYLNMLIVPMRSLGVTLGLAQRATASGARIFQVLDRPPRLTAPPDAPPLPAGNGHIQLRGVTLRYEDLDEFGATYSHSREGPSPPPAGSNGARQLGHPHRPRLAAASPAPARAVLRDVDLDVPAGRTVALVGATGSGKTSLVSLDLPAV